MRVLYVCVYIYIYIHTHIHTRVGHADCITSDAIVTNEVKGFKRKQGWLNRDIILGFAWKDRVHAQRRGLDRR